MHHQVWPLTPSCLRAWHPGALAPAAMPPSKCGVARLCSTCRPFAVHRVLAQAPTSLTAPYWLGTLPSVGMVWYGLGFTQTIAAYTLDMLRQVKASCQAAQRKALTCDSRLACPPCPLHRCTAWMLHTVFNFRTGRPLLPDVAARHAGSFAAPLICPG